MASRETVSIQIPAHLAAALREAVAVGEYASVDEAAADALTTWARRHADREEELAWVKARIKASIIDPRPSLSGAEVDAYLDALFEADEAAERRSDEAA